MSKSFVALFAPTRDVGALRMRVVDRRVHRILGEWVIPLPLEVVSLIQESTPGEVTLELSTEPHRGTIDPEPIADL